jgi:non-ribosomal peptide synthetase component F
LISKEFDKLNHRLSPPLCLPDLLLEQVRVRPDATAVVHDDEILTYRELADRSSALATTLIDLGVRPEDCVGLFVEPSAELIVGAWGILLAGAAYLPLAPEYPEERLRYMIEDARAGVIFCRKASRRPWPNWCPKGPGSSPWPTRPASPPPAVPVRTPTSAARSGRTTSPT